MSTYSRRVLKNDLQYYKFITRESRTTQMSHTAARFLVPLLKTNMYVYIL